MIKIVSAAGSKRNGKCGTLMVIWDNAMPAEIKVAMVPYYFKEKVSLCTTAMIFGVSLTNLSLSFRNVCLTIDTVMVQKMIESPSTLKELRFTNEAFLNRS